MKSVLIIVMTFMLLGVAAAESGNEFNTTCFVKAQDSLPPFDYGYCDGYITGALDTTVLSESMVDREGKPLSKQHVCMSEHVTHGQVLLIIKKYFTNNPEHFNWDAAILVHNALIDAFPCKDTK
jgi:hypothetical protein